MTGAEAAGSLISIIVLAGLIYGIGVIGWLRWFDK